MVKIVEILKPVELWSRQYTLNSYLFQTQRRKLPWQGQTLTSFLPPSGKEMILYPFLCFCTGLKIILLLDCWRY